jgi:hypothetical protein
MAANTEIWGAPAGYPSTVLSNGRPQTSTLHYPGFKLFPVDQFLVGNFTTVNQKGQYTTWTANSGWSTTGHSYSHGNDRGHCGISTKNENRGTWTTGPTSTRANQYNWAWLQDVMGVSFIYDRNDCYWSDGDIAIERVGLRLQSSTQSYEYTEILNLKSYGGSYSPLVGNKANTKQAPKAMSIWLMDQTNNTVLDWYRRQNFIWIGLYIQFVTTSGGAASHWKEFGISDIAPIYDVRNGVKCVQAAQQWIPSTPNVTVPIALL